LLIKIIYSLKFWNFYDVIKCWSILSVHKIGRYPWSTSQLIIDQHPDLYSVPTWLTLDQEPVSSQLNVNRLICINWKLVDQPNWLSTEMLIKCGSSVNQGVDRAAIDYQSSIAQEYWSRVYWSTLNRGCLKNTWSRNFWILKIIYLFFFLQAERDVRIAKELDLKLVYASKYVHCKEGQSKISYWLKNH